MRNIRIFVSSPSDVAAERQVAGRVIGRLQGKYWSFVRLDDVFWEVEPIRATGHYQDELISPANCEIVIGILWAKLGTPLPEKFRKHSGERYQSGTEWELETAFDAYEKSLALIGDPLLAKPDILVYRCNKIRLRNDDPNLEAAAAKQETLLNSYISRDFYNPDKTIRRPISHYHNLEEFEGKLFDHLEALILRLIPALRPGFDPPPISGSPFKGLQSFEFQDNDRFFGRNREIREIQYRLRRLAAGNSPFLLIYGGSGYGKSSLMRAGVAPILTRPGGALDNVKGWRRVVFQPGKGFGSILRRLVLSLFHGPSEEELVFARLHPDWSLPGLAELEAAIARSLDQAEISSPVDLLEYNFSNDSERLAATAAVVQILEYLDCHLLLQIDQLEEIFTTPEFNAEQISAFLLTISALVYSGRVWTVATMRNEYFSRVAETHVLRQLIGSEGSYILGPPSYQSLREMIRYPVLAARLNFQSHSGEFTSAPDLPVFDELDEQILADAAASPDALPLLEFTLQQLYDDRQANWLTWSSYKRMGGLRGSIANRAELAYGGLAESAKDARHWIFAALVRIDPFDHTISRKRANLESLFSFPGANTFITTFQQAHLLVTDEDRLTGQPVVSLSHEALFTHWQLLTTWIDQFKSKILARQRFHEQALLWVENGRKKNHLLAQGPLSSAEQAAASGFFAISEDEQSLLRLSHSRIRFTRWLTGGAVAALLCLSLVAFWLAKRATGAESNSSENHRIAEMERVARIAKEEEAKVERQRAETQNYFSCIADAKRALDREQLVEAKQFLDKAPASKRNWEWEHLRACLDTSLLTLHHRNADGACEVFSANFSPDGKWVVTAGQDGCARIWDTITGQQCGSFLHQADGQTSHPPYPVKHADFSPDGNSLVTSTIYGTIHIWNLKTKKESAKFSGSSESVKFDPTSRFIVQVGDKGNSATIWDVVNARVLTVCKAVKGAFGTATFSPNGKYLLTFGSVTDNNHDSAARVWDMASGEQLAEIRLKANLPRQDDFYEEGRNSGSYPRHDSGSDAFADEVTHATFDPTSSRVLVSTLRGSMVWTIGIAQPLMLKASEGAGNGTAWNQDGTLVAIGGGVWNTIDGSRICNLNKGGEEPEFSPSGKKLIVRSAGLFRIFNFSYPSTSTDPPIGTEIAVLRGHIQHVLSAHFSPDGSKVVTVAKDNSAKIWDALRDGSKRYGSPIKSVENGIELRWPDSGWIKLSKKSEKLFRGGSRQFKAFVTEPNGSVSENMLSGFPAKFMIWDVAASKEIVAFDGRPVAYSADESLILVAEQESYYILENSQYSERYKTFLRK